MKLMVLLTLTAAVPLAAPTANSSPDASFYKAAAQGGLSEVDLATLAQERSTDPKVKDFAAMMVKDHSAANEKLEALASSKNVSLPSSGGAAERATKTQLEALSGAAFDKSYIKSQLKAHTDTVALLKKEISTGQDAQAREFAQSILPTVQSHLKAIRTLAMEDDVKS
jgi:putative membrane protein